MSDSRLALDNFSFQNIKFNSMGNLLYIVAVVLLVFWVLGFFVYSVGSIIHILLVLAVISILVRIIQSGKIVK